MSITRVEYKVLDGAYHEDVLGHLLPSAIERPLRGEPFQVHPETTIEETSAALIGLLRRGFVELGRSGEKAPLPLAEAVTIASNPANWIAPRCWEYESWLTPDGAAAYEAA